MREQDKALFLQLIKLHNTIKEIRTEMKFIEENCDCPFDTYDGAASYWCKSKANKFKFRANFKVLNGRMHQRRLS